VVRVTPVLGVLLGPRGKPVGTPATLVLVVIRNLPDD
jgi:hypothetical protein